MSPGPYMQWDQNIYLHLWTGIPKKLCVTIEYKILCKSPYKPLQIDLVEVFFVAGSQQVPTLVNLSQEVPAPTTDLVNLSQ